MTKNIEDIFASMMACIDQEKLDKLAQVCVKVGLNLQEGQDLLITAPLVATPLVRLIAKHAYKQGAGVVTPFFGDDALTLARFENAKEESFSKAPNWLYDAMAKAYDQGAARLAIVGDDVMLLAQQDPERIAQLNKTVAQAYKPALERISQFKINWNIISYPHPSWARVVFKDLPITEAVSALSEAIFAASRLNSGDAVDAWAQHNKSLHARADWLNEQRFSFLHFKGTGTDLKIGLADDHAWHGGASKAQNGVFCNPNIPTEEVFTTPHAYRVDGFVRSTKPLAHQGTLIEDIEVRFQDGKIVEAKAAKGEEVFKKVLASDEGASRLGEVALVPHSSPISQSGLLFYNTLFDENASCHIALGQCYSKCFENGDKLTEEEISRRGGNKSLVHVDWMIGDAETDIDGIRANGEVVPVFRKGEWAQ